MSGSNISLVLFLAEESYWLENKENSDIYGCGRLDL